jgi:hypothetical protein
MDQRRTFLVGTALLVGLASGPRALAAQEVGIAGFRATVEGPVLEGSPPLHQPGWGTSATGVRTLHALGFQESTSEMTFDYLVSTGHRFRTGGEASWFDSHLPDLPAGALITGITIDACDTTASGASTLFLIRRQPGLTVIMASLSTGVASAPGCAVYGNPTNLVGSDFIVDNETNVYLARVQLTETDEATSFGSVRLYYRLQVSPAPAVATFPVDVPTSHPFFRFIEALAAAGITAGCDVGEFCPDDPLTRGQMAVFLAAALGLHFPN